MSQYSPVSKRSELGKVLLSEKRFTKMTKKKIAEEVKNYYGKDPEGRRSVVGLYCRYKAIKSGTTYKCAIGRGRPYNSCSTFCDICNGEKLRNASRGLGRK